MKYIITSFFIFFLVQSTGVFAQSDKVVGFWLTEKGDSQIQIFKSGNGKYYGNIVWLKDNINAKDDKNPDPKLRERKILGLQLLKGFQYNPKDQEWNNGTIYDPENGKTYDCFMRLETDNDQLHIKGFVLGMRFLGRETIWKREVSKRI